MFYLIIILFVLGYAAIALEHGLHADKTAVALITGALIWVCIAFGGESIYPALPSFQEYLQTHPDASVMKFITRHELVKYLGRIGEILVFLLGTMTVVKIIDSHGGFGILYKFIKTANKVKLLWIFSFLAFFMSAVVDNLTAVIVMIPAMWKLIGGKNTRWFFAGMIVIAANAGGAWSPIGDITTIMLWIGGQITARSIIMQLLVPSLICMLVPLIFVSLIMKGEAVPPLSGRTGSTAPVTDRERWIILLTGMGSLVLVPVFRSVTQLPPYMGVMLALGVMWIITEVLHRKKRNELKMRLTFTGILKKSDTSIILFFFGMLLAVAGLESAGLLNIAGNFLNEKLHSVYTINLAIGALSSVADNVPLVAGATGMFDTVSYGVLAAISDPARATYMKHFITDGSFWELLAYCAGNGGSILITGSTAGLAAMGLTKINFVWYVKRISLLALAGYLAGIAAYYLIVR